MNDAPASEPDPAPAAAPVARPADPPGRLAGIDFGHVRIGVALCDSRQTLVSPHCNYQRRGEQADAAYFRKLALDERITRFVLGLPVRSDGGETAKSREVRAFGDWLERTTGLPVVYFDERYSSVEAEQLLAPAEFTKKRRKARLDMLAAQVILSAYLESNRSGDAPGSLS
jgi:putative Holliday junction resolvase